MLGHYKVYLTYLQLLHISMYVVTEIIESDRNTGRKTDEVAPKGLMFAMEP